MPTQNFTTPLYAINTATTLSKYSANVLRLLHDEGGNIYSSTDVTSCINEARNRVVGDTACLRALQVWCLNTNQEAYQIGQIPAVLVTNGGSGYVSPTVTFSGGGATTTATATATVSGGKIIAINITNPGAGYDMVNSQVTMTISDSVGFGATFVFGAPSMSTLAVLGFSLNYSTTRYALDWKPWSTFSAKLRYWINTIQQPVCWAEYSGTVYVAPIPDQVYSVEEDSLFFPVPLVNPTDTDSIPIRYQSPIVYYAAHLLKYSEQSFGESDEFMAKYNEVLHNCIGSSIQRRIPSQYTTNSTGY